MTRHDSVAGLPVGAGRADGPWWLLGALGAALLVLAGCSHTGSRRAQAPDESEQQRYDTATVGDRTKVSNPAPQPLGGVGLVEGLEGTGGDCVHDDYRAMLVDQLRKERVPNVNKLLTSTECAVVIVEAQEPPGGSKGDRIDVQVKLPPGSKATSLRGGVLRKCYLFNYDFTNNLSPDYKGPRSLKIGHRRAIAQGPILIAEGDGEESARVKQGRIWGGAVTTGDYPLALVMNPDSQRAALTSLITDRINAAFQPAGLVARPDARIAHTADNLSIAIRVPAQYRHNLARYLRVVRLIPLTDSADAPSKGETDHRSYRQKLADDLTDPARTVVAALRLEALGAKSIPIFKERGLTHRHPLVRFCSAEALAYLGSPSCGDELHKAVVEQPLFRAFALTALASLNEAICHLKLKELVLSNLDDETRYGAFLALRTLNEHDPLVEGEQLNDSFWLHRVAKDSRPFIHLTTTRRAEVVLFGETPCLKPPFSILAGEFAVTATAKDCRCMVSRFPLHSVPAKRPCGLELEEVLRTMADLGAQYPEVIALLQQANACECLTCRVRVDALPQTPSVHDLAEAGKDAAELVPEGQDLGGTPELYQVGLPAADR